MNYVGTSKYRDQFKFVADMYAKDQKLKGAEASLFPMFMGVTGALLDPVLIGGAILTSKAVAAGALYSGVTLSSTAGKAIRLGLATSLNAGYDALLEYNDQRQQIVEGKRKEFDKLSIGAWAGVGAVVGGIFDYFGSGTARRVLGKKADTELEFLPSMAERLKLPSAQLKLPSAQLKLPSAQLKLPFSAQLKLPSSAQLKLPSVQLKLPKVAYGEVPLAQVGDERLKIKVNADQYTGYYSGNVFRGKFGGIMQTEAGDLYLPKARYAGILKLGDEEIFLPRIEVKEDFKGFGEIKLEPDGGLEIKIGPDRFQSKLELQRFDRLDEEKVPLLKDPIIPIQPKLSLVNEDEILQMTFREFLDQGGRFEKLFSKLPKVVNHAEIKKSDVLFQFVNDPILKNVTVSKRLKSLLDMNVDILSQRHPERIGDFFDYFEQRLKDAEKFLNETENLQKYRKYQRIDGDFDPRVFDAMDEDDFVAIFGSNLNSIQDPLEVQVKEAVNDMTVNQLDLEFDQVV